jgi:rhamnose transport system permease protein
MPSPSPAEPVVRTEAPLRERLFPNGEWVLLLLIAVECVLFGATGANFLTVANAMEITRLAVEVGLLALALTPIIITAGIDLSVGSMMGLAAITLGALWRDAGLPMAVAVPLTLLVSLAGGSLNALMISRLGFPPLIVTLGTYSLFRGAAEGLTRGIENYSGLPPGFLFLGQGYVAGFVPTQLFVLVAAIAGFGWWLHRTGHGRSLYRDRLLGRRRALRRRSGGAPGRTALRLVGLLSGSPRSSTWRTSARRRRTRARATS